MRRLFPAGLLLAAVPPLAGQSAFQVEVGGGVARHQYASESAALSVRPTFQWLGARERLDLAAVYSRDATFRWNAGATAGGALLRPLAPRVTMELGAEAWWTAHRSGAGTGEVALLPSWHLDTGAARWSLDAGAGYASTAGGGRGFGLLGIRGAGRVGPFELQGQVRHTRFAGSLRRFAAAWRPQYPVGGDTGQVTGADTAAALSGYSDLGLSVGVVIAGVRVQGVVEQRVGNAAFRATSWHLGAERFLTRELGIFASAGRTLSVLTSGLPARQYAAVGLKWVPGGRPFHAGAAPPPARSFRIEPAQPGWLRLLFRAPEGAAAAELRGDFTDWEPVALVPANGGWWSLVRALAPGLHRVEVRFDGGRWRAPDGIPHEKDEFDGEVGVLLIAP